MPRRGPRDSPDAAGFEEEFDTSSSSSSSQAPRDLPRRLFPPVVVASEMEHRHSIPNTPEVGSPHQEMELRVASSSSDHVHGHGDHVHAQGYIETDPSPQLAQDEANILAVQQLIKAQSFACIYSLPIITAIVAVLSQEWDQSCDSYLKVWVFGVGAFQVSRLPLRLSLIDKWQRVLDEPYTTYLELEERIEDVQMSQVHLGLYFLNAVSLLWYLLGTFEVFRKNDCGDRAPKTYALSLALVIIFCAFLGFSFMCRILYFCLLLQHHAYESQQGENPFDIHNGASESLVSTIPTFTYKQTPGAEADTCTICIEEFEENEKVATLPCGHLFHFEEISEWLKLKNSCPLCSTEVTKESISKMKDRAP